MITKIWGLINNFFLNSKMRVCWTHCPYTYSEFPQVSRAYHSCMYVHCTTYIVQQKPDNNTTETIYCLHSNKTAVTWSVIKVGETLSYSYNNAVTVICDHSTKTIFTHLQYLQVNCQSLCYQDWSTLVVTVFLFSRQSYEIQPHDSRKT